MHEDDLGSAVHNLFGPGPEVSAEERLRFQRKGRSTVRDVLWTNLKSYAVVYALLGIVAILDLIAGRSASALWLGIAFVCLFLFRLWFSLPRLFFAWMMEAKEWHRWDEVLRWCQRLEKMSLRGVSGLPAYSLANYRAQALAGRGDLPAALQAFQRFENDAQVPRWLYLSQLGGIYSAARDFQKAIDLAREAAELSPSTSALHVGLAEGLIFRKRDAKGARLALAKAEALPLPELASPFVLHCKGLIHLEEGDYASAREVLTNALHDFEKIGQHSLVPGAIRMVKASLSVACAKCGDAEQAEHLFKRVRAYLVAVKEDELRLRCEQAIEEARRSALPVTY